MANYNIWNNKDFSNAKISNESVKWLNRSGASIFTVGPNLYKAEIIRGVTIYALTSAGIGQEEIQTAILDNIWKKASYDNPTTSNTHRTPFFFFEINSKKIDLVSFKYKSVGLPLDNRMVIHSPEDTIGRIVVNLPDASNGIEVKDLIKQYVKNDIWKIRFCYYAAEDKMTLNQNFYIEVKDKWSSKIESTTFSILEEFKKNNLVVTI